MVRRFVCLLPALILVVPAFTQERSKEVKPDIAGKMTYDKERKTVTVTPPRGEPTKLQVEKGTEVMIDGKRGQITTIPDNYPVRIYLGPDKKVIRRLVAEGPTETLKVIAVNEGRRTVQFERQTETEEIALSPDASIVVNGRDAKISDVQPGDTAKLRFAIDRRTILAIQVGLAKPVEGKIPSKN